MTGVFQVIGFLDDSLPAGERVLGYPLLGAVESMPLHREVCDQGIVAIGNNFVREALMKQMVNVGIELATVIHPRAFLSPRALVGHGTAVMAGAIVGTEAQLGVGAIVNCGAVVDHHAQVEDFGHLGVNACMAGGSVLGRGAWMQAGSSLGYGVSVTAGSILQPGVALKNC